MASPRLSESDGLPDERDALLGRPRQEKAPGVRWRPIILIVLMSFLNGTASLVSVLPLMRVFQDIACRQYYADRPPDIVQHVRLPEKNCKLPEVQQDFSHIVALQSLFNGLCGLLLAILYGVFADKLGRRKVLVLSMMGQLVAACWVLLVCWTGLPLRWVWLSSIFTIVGGGDTVTAGISMLVIADAAPAAMRSRVFFQLQGSIMLAELISPRLTTHLMKRGLWNPIILGFVCTIISTFISFLVPETLRLKHSPVPSSDSLSDGDGAVPEISPSINEGSVQPSGKFKKPVTSWLRHIGQMTKLVISEKNLCFLIISFFIANFARQSLSFLFLYVSERYALPWRKAIYLMSGRIVAQLFFYILILTPFDVFLVERLCMQSNIKDLKMAKISIALISISFIALAFAPSMWLIIIGLVLYTLGSGFTSFVRSLFSSLVEPNRLGTLFMALLVMDTIGKLLSDPLVTLTFNTGVHLGGMWHALLYLVSFALCVIATLVISRVRIRVQDTEEPRSRGYGPVLDGNDLETLIDQLGQSVTDVD